MKTDIRAEIAQRRAEDVKKYGPAQGFTLPLNRSLPGGRDMPLIPFPQDPAVICEVKRCSPSVRNINQDLDPVELADAYIRGGARNISVLTEQNYFKGSLQDLMNIKSAYPEAAVLRKDFLLTKEDVRISYRAGADAFLLISSLLSKQELEIMYMLGTELGMMPLVELHSHDDVMKAADIRPALVGINSRDLRNFRIKPLQPLRIRSMIDWNCRIIYESGIRTDYDASFVRSTGFSGVLVGEAVVRKPDFSRRLAETFSRAEPQSTGENASGLFGFWKKLYERSRFGRPLVKICGITNRRDLEAAAGLGADAAGFILAESPRRVDASFIESCRDIGILKVGVVVLTAGQQLPGDVVRLLETGALDAIQFHGDELPEEYLRHPGYKAVRLRGESDVEEAGSLPGPAVLVDAFSEKERGGTGRQIDPELVERIAGQQTLWLAGGINPENVREIITRFSPDLIDVSSGVESVPGRKDQEKLKNLFVEIDTARNDLLNEPQKDLN